MWGTAGPGAAAESTVQPSEQRGKLVPTGGLATGTLTPSGEAVRALSLSPYQGLAQTGTAPLMPSGSELVRYETERNPEKLEQAQAEQLAGLQKQKAEADEMYETYSALYGSWSTNAEEKAEALKQKERFAGESRELQKQIDGLRGYTAPSFGERIGKTLRGAGKQYVGSIWDAAGASMPNGTAVTGVYEDQLASLYGERSRTEAWLADPEDEQERVQLESRLDAINSQIAVYEASVRANKGVSEAARDAAAEITHSGAQDIERAKVDAGTGTKLLIDAGVAGAQMLGDAGIGTATGTGAMLPMLVRSFGSGTQEAREKGYSQEQQIALGLASAATEYITEKLFGGNPVYDTDAGLVNKLVSRLTDNEALIKALSSAPAEKLYEGLEEMASDVLNPIAEYVITGNWDMQGVDEILRDGAVGVITALAMGGAGKVGETAGRTVQKVSDTVMLSRYGEEVENKNAAPANAGTAWSNTRLTESDLGDYLQTGERQHVRDLKAGQLRSGELPILTNVNAIRHFIGESIKGKKPNIIKGYGKVGPRLANAVINADARINGGTLNISGYYLELEANHLAHLSDHIETDTDTRNIALTEEQVLQIPEYIDHFDDVLDVIRRKDGSIRIKLGKQINGHSIIIETVSKGRASLHPVTAWGMSTEDYIRKYKGNKKQTEAVNTSHVTQDVTESGYKPHPSVNANIPQDAGNVNEAHTENSGSMHTGSESNAATSSEQAEQLREEYRRVRELETARRIAEKFGARLELGSIEGGADGRYQNGVITIDPNTESPVMRVLVHELTHHMERSGLYGKFSQEILSYISEWSQWSNYL